LSLPENKIKNSMKIEKDIIIICKNVKRIDQNLKIKILV
jgi:hypothetical protein